MKKIITSILVATSLASLFLNTNDLLGTTRSFFDTSSIVVAFLFLMALLVKNLPNKNEKSLNIWIIRKKIKRDMEKSLIPFAVISYILSDYFCSKFQGYPSAEFRLFSALPALYIISFYLLVLFPYEE